jgi:hypothetical protein
VGVFRGLTTLGGSELESECPLVLPLPVAPLTSLAELPAQSWGIQRASRCLVAVSAIGRLELHAKTILGCRLLLHPSLSSRRPATPPASLASLPARSRGAASTVASAGGRWEANEDRI